MPLDTVQPQVCWSVVGANLVDALWTGFALRLAFTMAIFNVLVQWDGIQTDSDGTIRLSIAQFSV